jgi:hypothetical protein
MKTMYLTAVMAFCLFVNGLYAQSYMIDSAGNKVPVVHPIVHSKPPETEDIRKPVRVANDNVLKLGLLYWVSGCIPIYYERKITPWLSLEGGLGLTTRDFVADVVNIYLNGINDNEGLNPYYQYHARKSEVGVYASLQPKFYIRNNAIEGFWFGPMLEFKRFDYKAGIANVNSQGDANGNPIYLNTYQPEHRNAVDFTFNVGWQFKYRSNLALEYSMGAGFRRFWEQRSDVEYASGLTSGPPYFSNGIRDYNGYRPEFNMALSFGGFF